MIESSFAYGSPSSPSKRARRNSSVLPSFLQALRFWCWLGLLQACATVLEWKSKGTGLIFPSPVTGYSYDASPIQQDWIRRAGWCLVPCAECGAEPGVACTVEKRGRGKKFNIPVYASRRESATEKVLGSVGWHTFRHTYRTFLGESKAPLEIQKALMRQADISTILKYGRSSTENQRKANRMVVWEILIRRSLK